MSQMILIVKEVIEEIFLRMAQEDQIVQNNLEVRRKNQLWQFHWRQIKWFIQSMGKKKCKENIRKIVASKWMNTNDNSILKDQDKNQDRNQDKKFIEWRVIS